MDQSINLRLQGFYTVPQLEHNSLNVAVDLSQFQFGFSRFKTLMKQNKTSPRILWEWGCVGREMCLLVGCGHEGEEKKDLIFMSHWGLYGEFNPRVLCRSWCLGHCQVRVEMRNYQAQHMYNDLFISPQTLSLCLSSASISTAWCAHIHHAHTYYKLFKWALCLLLGRVNRKSGGEGRQRGRVLEERQEGVQMNRRAAVKCSY